MHLYGARLTVVSKNAGVSIKTVCLRTPMRRPFPSHQPFVEFCIYDSVLILGERDETVGWIIGLLNSGASFVSAPFAKNSSLAFNGTTNWTVIIISSLF